MSIFRTILSTPFRIIATLLGFLLIPTLYLINFIEGYDEFVITASDRQIDVSMYIKFTKNVE